MNGSGGNAGMSGNAGGNGGDARSGASDGAVLLDRQYVWPGDLTEIPDWVYTDETIYKREIERMLSSRRKLPSLSVPARRLTARAD
jgi:hypothetical protein